MPNAKRDSFLADPSLRRKVLDALWAFIAGGVGALIIWAYAYIILGLPQIMGGL